MAGDVIVGLVREFMAWAGLSFSIKVFDAEVSGRQKLSRDTIQERLGLHELDETPLLGAILKGFLSQDLSQPEARPSRGISKVSITSFVDDAVLLV
eukprot:scaffold647967_cov49-Prasinocladus_malaysianus.AAC.1